MNQFAKPLVPPTVPSPVRATTKCQVPESLFERFAGIYIFCRENLFRDDTERIIRRVWANSSPAAGARILELGCGPGFYSCILATRFPEASFLGIDNCKRQIDYAGVKARERGVRNCQFERGNVLDLAHPDGSFGTVIASRLFTVVPERERAVAEIFRVLKPGGKCFIAEPRFAFSASIPLLLMHLLGRLGGYTGEYREPARATALSLNDFRGLFQTQPWAGMEIWRAGRYQYALCEKG